MTTISSTVSLEQAGRFITNYGKAVWVPKLEHLGHSTYQPQPRETLQHHGHQDGGLQPQINLDLDLHLPIHEEEEVECEGVWTSFLIWPSKISQQEEAQDEHILHHQPQDHAGPCHRHGHQHRGQQCGAAHDDLQCQPQQQLGDGRDISKQHCKDHGTHGGGGQAAHEHCHLPATP